MRRIATGKKPDAPPHFSNPSEARPTDAQILLIVFLLTACQTRNGYFGRMKKPAAVAAATELARFSVERFQT